MAPPGSTSPKPLVESNKDLDPQSSPLEKFTLYETRAVCLLPLPFSPSNSVLNPWLSLTEEPSVVKSELKAS
jgi:hypothetical protein